MPILKRNGKTFSGTPTKVDTANSYTTFDSADDKNPTTWSDVELLTSKEEQRSLFSKISTMFKNIRYLYKILGTTDISHYSDGTVTGAIKAACDKSDANETAIADVNSKLGNTDISAIGDGTLTGGLSILNNNAYDLKMLGWTVPKECPVQNYVDEDGVFHQIVGRVDLSKLMWEWADTLNEFRTDLYIMGMNPYSTNIYCSKYKFGSEMYISGMGIYIKDPNYDSSTISQFKADNKGVYFYYELATEITKPVDGNEAIKLLNDKLGNTDISSIGDGTVTGGLNALNSNLQSKCDNVSQLPQYTYHFGSFDGMVSGDAFSSLKALRKTTREPFKRGSLISIEKIKDSGAYDTFIIGSTDPDFFRGLCLSYYSEPYYFKYSNGVWTE